MNRRLIGLRGLAQTTNNHLKRLVADANLHPGDATRQLRVLQALSQVHPSLVVQRVEGQRFAMSQEAQRLYMRALVSTSRMDSIDMNVFLNRMQNASTTRATHAQMNNDLTHGLGHGEAYTRFWAFFGTALWGGLVVSSVKAFVEDQQHAKPPMTHVGRALRLHLNFIDNDDDSAGAVDAQRLPATRKENIYRVDDDDDGLTTPYENVWDINME
ncbi:hypothetical protein SPRG_04129 [Saprolegnia parasitica CBS 223.65]|uniref:Uncharacterized protein n=1 Tax=Saprolegnia parasitica (strain CBS 223.65) TaxID=695850 RepID=A0A067CWM5_SAPPC|nr:hypothetical protein SPRG_04129 [Saprolegnia parasitica CBS 223.65]KDO30941.1 hypothetical protein SPRG_04129 [Saprolegnia parasitica CBS 223.65]|eukprot:XP_012198125.1 hypothetical protein SPRG_04129 [Saprolegnia parasitica CBS 223.65]